MQHLKRLTLAFTLMSILATAAFAGETETPPCANPGQTNSPPCAPQSVNDDSAVPGETHSPPVVPAVDVTDITETVMWALSLVLTRVRRRLAFADAPLTVRTTQTTLDCH